VRVGRTRSSLSAPRSPQAGCPIGGARAMKRRVASLAVLAFSLASCERRALPCDTASVGSVRKALESAYAANEAAFAARDPDAVMKLRHPDFHTIDERGRLSTRQQMSERTRSLVQRIIRFDVLRETIQQLEVHGDTAIATVFQETSRQQRLGDGTQHRIDTSVTQREWWRCTPEGWRLWRVDEIRNPVTLLDGRPLPQ